MEIEAKSSVRVPHTAAGGLPSGRPGPPRGLPAPAGCLANGVLTTCLVGHESFFSRKLGQSNFQVACLGLEQLELS